MSRLFIFLSAIFFCVSFLFAETDSADKTKFSLLADSATHQPIKMDFSKPLTGISDPGLLFAQFAKQPLLIYYFSPKCVHCQHHFPEFQNLIKEYESFGMKGIGIALGGYIKKNDIRLFIDQFNASVSVFQDSETQFGSTYGTGYVPVTFLVLADGTFYRYDTLNAESMAHIRSVLNSLFQKK